MIGSDAVWIEHIDEVTCWHLLSSLPVGRVGVVFDSGPEIYPVNHVVDDGTIVFRTDVGSKLHALSRTPTVCFQVDGFDADHATGWSVLVKGRAVALDDDEVERAADLPLRIWGIGDKTHWIRIVPDEVTGRKIHRDD